MLKRRSFEDQNEQRKKKKTSTKKLERESLLNNFPLFTQLGPPNRFSILNINYNKFHDNNIIQVRSHNSHSSVRTKSNPKVRSEIVKQNLRDILSSKMMESKKKPSFIKSGLERKKTLTNLDDKKQETGLRKSSQKSSLFKQSVDKSRVGGFHFLVGAKTDNKSKKSLVSTKEKLSGVFGKTKNAGLDSFKPLRAEKSLPSNIGLKHEDHQSFELVDQRLLTSALIFRRKFMQFVKSVGLNQVG